MPAILRQDRGKGVLFVTGSGLARVARDPVPIDPVAVRSAAPLALLVLLAACPAPAPPEPEGGPVAGEEAVAPPPPGSLAPWSRPALELAGDRGGRAGPPPLGSVVPKALEEIVAAAPSATPAATGEDGGTRIGTETGLPAVEARAPTEAAEPRTHVQIGAVKVAGQMSTPAIEKAARAQLYWILVQRCRGPDGNILPPDTITLSFNIDADGTILPASILATAAEPQYEEAAACMRKELSSAPFRAPPGARGQPTRVDATVPSVD
jgi:hypothetical protein